VFPDLFAEIKVPEIEGLADHLEKELTTAVKQAAGRVVAVAVPKAPVDTGALRNSIGVMTFGGGGDWAMNAERARSAARTKGREVGLHAPEPPMSQFEAIVFAGVEYARFMEFGTKYFTGRFFMTAAAGAAQERILPQEIDAAIERAKRRG